MSLLVSKTPTAINLGLGTGGGTNTISIGNDAASGPVAQGSNAVAIGYSAGIAGGDSSVSIGDSATATDTNGVAIGKSASVTLASASVAIGAFAEVRAVEQAIVINGTGATLSTPADHTFVVHPVGIRADNTGLLPLYYDLVTNEIVIFNNTPLTFTVTFSSNGGTGTMLPVTEQAGSKFNLPSSTLTPPVGKTFASWNTKQNGSGTEYPAGSEFTVVRNQTLYAIWVTAPGVTPA